ncbi:FtsW/RodA/SpoVE family cell cycle protein [Anaerococcus hydrogenalis]|uniref:Cell cycle protein n=1 Tax=Anaerococcus hydrogenalis TaxID=33029 RepID=A0A2N6UKY6_9FIRM|nr:FtsW/RodA/SpoVE family cell cycle protein [Anaerococcus hydrogenalis]MDK7694473.1 FtsW/RodA/SpoVE family cell cycle protein [Anaerococcus hydrogenalis]MDK7696251.1 FtsW/RodA/SpoVE family cell cycle protein [Anaerococcus hydrogenalis]MDK7707500.1 FtsW/RodA/SpoVE family cell cycle protein [Anaerococcus hydrogenalis]PMC82513.1 cell cycle protein [Anaerococcus hydrogenalis]
MKMLKKENKNILNQKKYKAKALFLLFVFEFLSLSLSMIYNADKLKGGDFYAYVAILAITIISTVLANKLTRSDSILLLIVNMLFSIGVVMIYRLDPALGKKQLLFYFIGVIVFFTTYYILPKNKNWDDHIVFYFVVSIVLFVATLIFGFASGGAKNWITLGPISIQPSEFIKIPFIFFIASFYTNYNKYKKKAFGKYYLSIGIYIFILMFFIQKELGTALIFFGTMILTQFVYERDRKLIFVNLILVILGAILAYFLFSHIRVRVETWIDPWSVIDDKGYQITQSLFALASGGLFGTGIGLGRPDYIPVAESDFIFPAICEEYGIFMGIAVVLLFLILVYRAIKVSLQQENKFYSILAFCIGVLFALQTLIILGGVLKLIPLTGVTLPFISAGGSSMVSGFILLAILQFCGQNLENGDENEKEKR